MKIGKTNKKCKQLYFFAGMDTIRRVAEGDSGVFAGRGGLPFRCVTKGVLFREVPPSGAGDFYPQGARRIRKAAKPLTAAQARSGKVTKTLPKP